MDIMSTLFLDLANQMEEYAVQLEITEQLLDEISVCYVGLIRDSKFRHLCV